MKLNPANVQYLIVHCSATPPSIYVDASVITSWHRQRGFAKGGYHKIIRRDGVVENGRALNEVGAHAVGFNSKSVGICLAGGVTIKNVPVDNFTVKQKNSLVVVLKELKALFKNARVLGHRDIPGVKKACPSFDVRKWWGIFEN